MSKSLIAHSPDLLRLRDEGYHVAVKHGHLVVSQVPYVNASRRVLRGILISDLNLAGEVTTAPNNHVAHFAGECPCDSSGASLDKVVINHTRHELVPGIPTGHMLSNKPTGPDGMRQYTDYYEKMTTYINLLLTHAHALDATVTANVYPAVAAEDEDSVFLYEDTASSRAQITVVTQKLALPRIAIIGLGGTGSYILDLVAKTPIRDIHLFDGDKFLQHNAFRAPGAASLEELQTQPFKVNHFAIQYGKMRRGIIPHPYFIDDTNISELAGFSFVFLSFDKGKSKRHIVQKLEEFGVPFTDVGMGVDLVDGSLGGVLRVTTSTPQQRDHLHSDNVIPFTNGDANDDYSRNIQIADLNALNAALAVVKWKKLFGFYHDIRHEHHSTYTVDVDMLTNEVNAVEKLAS